jgi:hypothetical protein
MFRLEGDFVYVNQDGAVRELSLDEKKYLSTPFHPCDGARPYIKHSYDQRNGWGSISGFILREKIPHDANVHRVNPECHEEQADAQQLITDSAAVGDHVTKNADGSITCTPNPNMSREERFEMFRRLHLERQALAESRARHPHNP